MPLMDGNTSRGQQVIQPRVKRPRVRITCGQLKHIKKNYPTTNDKDLEDENTI